MALDRYEKTGLSPVDHLDGVVKFALAVMDMNELYKRLPQMRFIVKCCRQYCNVPWKTCEEIASIIQTCLSLKSSVTYIDRFKKIHREITQFLKPRCAAVFNPYGLPISGSPDIKSKTKGRKSACSHVESSTTAPQPSTSGNPKVMVSSTQRTAVERDPGSYANFGKRKIPFMGLNSQLISSQIFNPDKNDGSELEVSQSKVQRVERTTPLTISTPHSSTKIKGLTESELKERFKPLNDYHKLIKDLSEQLNEELIP